MVVSIVVVVVAAVSLPGKLVQWAMLFACIDFFSFLMISGSQIIPGSTEQFSHFF